MSSVLTNTADSATAGVSDTIKAVFAESWTTPIHVLYINICVIKKI
jgi:hypothetical protein